MSEYGFPRRDRPKKFGDFCLWYQWTKKGKVAQGFPKRAIAIDFNTVTDAVGIFLDGSNFFDRKYVMKEELKKLKKSGGK